MFSEAQRKEFDDRGVLFLPGAADPDRAASIRDATWSMLEKRDGILRDDPESWRGQQPKAVGNVGSREDRLALLPEDLLDEFSHLLGGKPLPRKRDGGQILITFPNARQWRLPHNVWHFDIPRLPGSFGRTGVQFFTFLEPCRSGGGGTAVIAGSHRLLSDLNKPVNSGKLKPRLKRSSPWYRNLWSKDFADRAGFMDQATEVSGVPQQVIELTGDIGDLWLMDMRCFHTVCPNAGSRARMMLTERFVPEDVQMHAFGRIQTD